MKKLIALTTAVLLGFTASAVAQPTPGGGSAPPLATKLNNLRVGAAKVDITPTAAAAPGLKNVWGTAYTGIHDHTFIRAIVVNDGKTDVALVSVDTSGTPLSLALRQRVEKATGVPAGNILIGATHTHNAPVFGQPAPGATPEQNAFFVMAEEALVQAIREAKAKQQPGKMVTAEGRADLNINRDEFVGDRWKTGRNPDRPSDKTVWVLRFETAAGEPLAYYVNYGVHALTLGPDNTLVTGDFPGATSRYIEDYYQDKVVALWVSGPAGDQNLITTSWDLDDKLTHKVRVPGEAGFKLADAMGTILGEEAIRAAGASKDVTSSMSLYTEARNTMCPGHALDRPLYAATNQIKFADTGQDVPIQMNLVMLNDVALTGVAAEVVTKIYWNLKAKSPLRKTILVSLANGSSNYLPDDASYSLPIFEVRSSRVKPGCAEPAIVDGFSEMIAKRLESQPNGTRK